MKLEQEIAKLAAEKIFETWENRPELSKEEIVAESQKCVGLSPHPAWPHMVCAVAASGLPRGFPGDFWVHDRFVLSQNHPEQPFLWCIGETGTTLLWAGQLRSTHWSKRSPHILLRNLKEERPHFYEWDGANLNKVDDKRALALLEGK